MDKLQKKISYDSLDYQFRKRHRFLLFTYHYQFVIQAGSDGHFNFHNRFAFQTFSGMNFHHQFQQLLRSPTHEPTAKAYHHPSEFNLQWVFGMTKSVVMLNVSYWAPLLLQPLPSPLGVQTSFTIGFGVGVGG